MKKLVGLTLLAGLFSLQIASAQNQQEAIPSGNSKQVAMAKGSYPSGGENDKKAKGQVSNIYNSSANKPTSTFTPAGSSSGGFTVRKFEESKVAKKLRRGEARSRFSVPNPKGKPLVHKKRGRFQLFG